MQHDLLAVAGFFFFFFIGCHARRGLLVWGESMATSQASMCFIFTWDAGGQMQHLVAVTFIYKTYNDTHCGWHFNKQRLWIWENHSDLCLTMPVTFQNGTIWLSHPRHVLTRELCRGEKEAKSWTFFICSTDNSVTFHVNNREQQR